MSVLEIKNLYPLFPFLTVYVNEGLRYRKFQSLILPKLTFLQVPRSKLEKVKHLCKLVTLEMAAFLLCVKSCISTDNHKH